MCQEIFALQTFHKPIYPADLTLIKEQREHLNVNKTLKQNQGVF